MSPNRSGRRWGGKAAASTKRKPGRRQVIVVGGSANRKANHKNASLWDEPDWGTEVGGGAGAADAAAGAGRKRRLAKACCRPGFPHPRYSRGRQPTRRA